MVGAPGKRKTMTEESKPKNFAEAIKAAAKKTKLKVPAGTAAKVQQAKFKNQVTTNRPTKRAAGRGG
jgi:hypothetical protein